LPRLLEVTPTTFLVFMNVQALFAVVLASLAGPGLIAPDLANNALPLYFSRPLSRADYVLARLLVLVGMLSLITWVPGLVLFWLQSGMAGWTWFSANWRVGSGVFAGFLIWIVIVSLVALAGSAYVKWRIIGGAVVLGFFFVLAGAGQMVNAIFRVSWGWMMNPAMAANRIWCSLLDVAAPPDLSLSGCIAMLSLLSVFLVVVLERKLRAVEVIR